MLAHDDGAVGDQSLSGSALLGDVEPGVGVHDLHGDGGEHALDAQIEGGVAGDDLSVAESAHVADLHVAVGVKALGLGLGGQLAGLGQLLQLEAGHDAGDIAALVDRGESVLEVVQAGDGGEVTGHGNEGDIGVLLGNLDHVGLMAVGIGEDGLAALADQVLGGIGAVRAFLDLVLPDDLVVGHAQLGGGVLDALDVGGGIALGLVTDQDHTDLQVAGVTALSGGLAGAFGGRGSGSGGGSSGAAGGHAEHHGAGQNNAQQFLHVHFPPLKFYGKKSKTGYPIGTNSLVDESNMVYFIERARVLQWFLIFCKNFV